MTGRILQTLVLTGRVVVFVFGVGAKTELVSLLELS